MTRHVRCPLWCFALALVGGAVQTAACASSQAELGFAEVDGGAPSPADAGVGYDSDVRAIPDFGDADLGGGQRSVDAGGDGPCVPNLTGQIRDFKSLDPGRHPDFETPTQSRMGSDPGIVEAMLGADQKPVYAAHPSGTKTTTSAALFDQWYRDTPGVNLTIPYQVQLTPGDGGISTFAQEYFFPVDGQGWNDMSPPNMSEDGQSHNFSFTFELHTTFEYMGGEVFAFLGDDDVWVFINKHLAVDLGGVHDRESATVTLDAVATQLGLAIGVTYPLDIFQAERHTAGSHFHMDTSIRFNNCTPIIR